jgi:hypothetical protein
LARFSGRSYERACPRRLDGGALVFERSDRIASRLNCQLMGYRSSVRRQILRLGPPFAIVAVAGFALA